MKHIFTTLLIAGGLAFTATAQNPNQVGGPSTSRTVTFKDKSAMTAKYSNHNRATSYWLNYAFAADSLYGGIGTLNANYLFQDSTVLGEFGTGTFDYVWIHSIAQSLDPTAYYHNYYSGSTMTDADAYSVDSMGIYYIYERNIQNPGIVDTLIIKLTNNATTTNYQANGFIGATAANYGTDTICFRLPKYDNVANTANGTANTTMWKVPLTQADSSVTFVGYKQFATPGFQVGAGRIAGVSISFKPGYSYAFGDTLETELNSFLFTSMEEQGANTFPIYNDCNYLSANCDYNMSGIVRTQERYAVTGNSWNGNYIPTLAFTQGYSLEHHWIDWLVTTPPTSIEENSLGVSLGQNVPNPAAGTTMINYELKNAGKVSFEVYDIAGKQVFSSNEGNKAAGKHSFQLNVDNYNAGVYFYTLTVDGVRVTKKMTISE